MSTSLAVLHIGAIARGLAASFCLFGLLYVAGLGVVPGRWQDRLGRGGHPAVIGAALYLLMCWYGLQLGIRLTTLANGFAVLSLVLGILRANRVVAALRQPASRRKAAGWLALFAGLYVLSYLFTLPTVTGEHLPIAWTGNIDLLIYIDYTSYLQRLGPPQPAELYLSTKDYVYFQTPGVYHLLGGYSAFFGGDPMRAAMPAQFALAALVGVVTAGITRRVFGASSLPAALIAAVTVCGPFFRYVAANYFLSSLVAMPVLLHFLLTTVAAGSSRRVFDAPLAWSCAAHEIVLFFVYPFLFLVALVFQAAAVFLAAIAAIQDAIGNRGGQRFGDVLPEAARRVTALLLGVVAVGALAPVQAAWTLRMIRDLSRPGVWGWALDVISPSALLGLPGTMYRMQASTPFLRQLALAGLASIGLVLAAAFFWWFRRRTTREQRVLAALSALGFLGYAVYFLRVGVSYQQWKMASYLVLPLAFVPLAGAFRLAAGGIALALATRPVAARRATTIALLLVGLGFVCGNVIVHARHDPRLHRPAGKMRNIAKIDALPSFRDVWIATPHRDVALLAAYYLPRKRLHVFGPKFYPPASFEAVSAAQPLLMADYPCDVAGHDETLTIDGVGCLLFAPPSASLETAYPFSRNFLFVHLEGLGPREGWGRWNNGRTAELKLTADPRRVALDRAAYLNLRLQPALSMGTGRQRVRLSWGTTRRAEASLVEQGWISLPLRPGDWSGEWLATQVVSFEFPNAIPPHWVEGRYLESRPLAVGFLELSFSTLPRGGIVALQR